MLHPTYRPAFGQSAPYYELHVLLTPEAVRLALEEAAQVSSEK